MKKLSLASVLCLSVGLFLIPTISQAKNMAELDKEISEAQQAFENEVKNGENILDEAEGYLIFPEVTKAGLGVGGEYGKGALFVDGKIKDYYSTKAASLGLQVGMEQKSIIVTFLTEEALNNFVESDGWEVGVDGSVSVAKIGTDGSINTTTTANKSIVAYVYGKSGLMADVSLSGSKFSKLEG